jgi:RHS repeat-associated protein
MRERGLLLGSARTYNGLYVLTAEQTSGSPGAALPQAKTRVWGSRAFPPTRIGGSSDLSSTTRLGYGRIYDKTASGRLVDGIYRLTNEANSTYGAVSYGLDPVGNRLSQTSSMAGIQSGTFGYDADDRLSTEQYDNNGNTIVSGARTFAYDFENRLKSMNNGAVTMLYDADGNRVGKNTTRYLVDELNPTGYAQVVEELEGTTVTRRYTYGLQRISETQLLNGAWTTSFYGYDGFGTVRQLTDPTGAVTDTYDYDAWGNTVNQTGSTPNVYRYRGEQYDPDLNLYYLRARYLNPQTGRFFSRDPKSFKPLRSEKHPSSPKSLHRYLYVGGNPIRGLDPRGLEELFEEERAEKEDEELAGEVVKNAKFKGLQSAIEQAKGLLGYIDETQSPGYPINPGKSLQAIDHILDDIENLTDAEDLDW